MNFKAGDWVVFELKVGQIKEIRDNDCISFSDGYFESSGRLTDRFRLLTLKNKNIVETFNIYYERLREIDGEAGFNYPDIHDYFSQLALDEIDTGSGVSFDKAQKFVHDARSYTPIIDGVRLFRRK